MSKTSEIEKYVKKKKRAILDGKSEHLSNVCIKLAELYTETGNATEAIEEYEYAATILNDLNKNIEYGTVHRMIGEIYTTHLCDFGKALEHQAIHLKIARKENNKVEEQRALATIGRTHFCAAIADSNNINDSLLIKAYSAYTKSLNICENLTGISKYELSDMKARLLLNIGNIHEQQGDFEKALKCLEAAKKMSKSMDLYETHLIVLNAMSSLFIRKKDYQVALQCLNEAYDVADRLSHDKNSHLCEILQSKAEIFVQQDDFCSTKNALIKAYKLKASDQSVRDHVERMLKAAAFVYYNEKKLLSLKDEECEEKKKVCEKLGDAACELQNYPKAIFYYQKMLDYIKTLNETGSSLSAAYVSLAQTHKDNKNYNMAFQYFQKELDRCCGQPEETIDTLINLAEVAHLRGDTFENIIFYLDQARAEAKHIKSLKLESKVIKHLLDFYEKYQKFDLAKNLEKEKKYLNIPDEPFDEETSETQEFLKEVDISTISDPEDDIEVQETEQNSSYSIRKRNRINLKKTKNEKGETPLHVACIKGSYTMVEKLLDQGHPINERDNSGWTPLHEACNHGHLEIVELLVNHGASINDRGGKHCGGCTPLLDAAGNGHLDIVELLIKRGASATTQDDAGRNVLDILIKWHEENIPLSELDENKYNTIVNRLKNDLKSLGWVENQSKTSPCKSTFKGNRRNVSLIDDDFNNVYHQSNSSFKKMKISSSQSYSSPEKKNRVNRNRIAVDDNDDLVEQASTSSASSEYKKVMNHIRGKIDSKPSPSKSNSTINSLIPESDNVIDDWLIDDTEPSRVFKRKRVSSPELSVSKFKPTKSEIQLNVRRNISSSLSLPSDENRKIQSSLLSTGFSKRRSNDSIESVNTQSSFGSTQAETLLNDTINSTQFVKSLRIDIHIEDTLWIIPIDPNKTHINTIEWLAAEAAKRYYNQKGRFPVLELITKDKGIFNSTDNLSLITHFSELYSNILSWNNPPIANRYFDQCKLLKLVVNQRIFRYLDSKRRELVLDFSHFGLTYQKAVPIILALRYHERVEEINLASNFLGDENLKAFFEYLPTISNVKKVTFSCNIITKKGISTISQICFQYDRNVKLSEIDFSFNTLENESFEDLLSLTSYLNLEKLRLASCAFDENLLNNCSIINLNHLKTLSTLDLSENQIGASVLRKLLNGLDHCIVKELYLASTTANDGSIVSELIEFFEQKPPSNLEILDLRNCQVEDYELLKLIPLLQKCDNLKELCLSQNDKLTMISLQTLIGNGAFVETLKLEFCSKLYNEVRADDELFLNEKSLDKKNNKLRLFQTTCSSPNAVTMLQKFWNSLWEDEAIIKHCMNTYYYFSVNDF